ncbi:hypothetical protein H9Q72_006083 [Fusarium xylarioides]|uniref:DUF6546 domain-containing protein n=1 Tax=Fusarium xylarioides TaxID=221167 RepID=A0A9P7HTP6_9HYPO|nr:hypothetical protein H9Q70_006935 [Fusarium xylarioides]KAG5765831.1 hypothetical protein H9Q72_006083 [Fusarium xylarioides]KAG5785217.1 hypothetical protein H9Q73_001169 [Fusarium xylarioides]
MVTLRSHTRARKARRSSWAFLPQEIRRMILEEISRQRRWSCASTVCKEWHAIVASKNLYRLELNRASAQGLKTITLQRHLIRRIYLNIELPFYKCFQCQGHSSSISPVKLTEEALQKLSKALAAWEPTHHITLELNAYSPSDLDHCFKNHLYGFKHENDGNLLEKQKSWDDPIHGWVKGKQVRPPTTAAILQLFRTVIAEVGGKRPPKVPAVKGVVIRRQMRCQINRVALSKLLKQFPNLESINYEPWRALSHVPDLLHDQWLQDGLPTWPQHVRSVTIFEDFNEQIMEAFRSNMAVTASSSTSTQIETPRRTKYELGEAFAVKSRNFEHLSVSFMIDARHFFTSCKMIIDWPRLRSLILTTPLMTKGSRGRISDFLVNAGQVAQKMQHLKSLAIWHCSYDEACAVVFQKNENGGKKVHGSATLTWRGTRDFDFSEEVVETWQKVVCTCNSRQGYVGQCDSHQLLCKIERVEGEIISHGDAIHHLRLPGGVIDPTSLRQIRQEGILQREAWAVNAEPVDGSEEDP